MRHLERPCAAAQVAAMLSRERLALHATEMQHHAKWASKQPIGQAFVVIFVTSTCPSSKLAATARSFDDGLDRP